MYVLNTSSILRSTLLELNMSVSYQSQQSSDDESLHPSNLRHSSTLEHSLYYEANEFQGTPLLPPSSSVDQSRKYTIKVILNISFNSLDSN